MLSEHEKAARQWYAAEVTEATGCACYEMRIASLAKLLAEAHSAGGASMRTRAAAVARQRAARQLNADDPVSADVAVSLNYAADDIEALDVEVAQ